MDSLQDRVKRKKKSRGKRILVAGLLLFIFLASVGLTYILIDVGGGDPPPPLPPGKMKSDKLAIMVMGVDRRSDDVGRSDTLMVATVDPDKKAAAVLSIPRDTRVKITGHGYDKINHAYAFGGHRLTQESVQNLLGVRMDYYVLIDTHAFERIIDALGGVDINVEKRMYYEDPWDDDGGLVINLRPGMQHMDGKTAIQYVRYRDEEGDIGRIGRQQKFINAVMDKLSSASILMKLPTIIQEVSSAVETDMSISKMISLTNILQDAKAKGMNTDMVPGKPAYINEINYWLPDVVKLRRTLATLLDVKMDDQIVQAMQQDAKEYETSIPKEMKVVETPEEMKKVAEKEMKKDKPKDDKKKNAEKDEKKNAETDEMTDKKKTADQKKKPSVVQVEVVNASGIDGAGAEVAGILRRQGFSVTGISTMTAPYKNTVVITNSSSDEVVGKFGALPFAYSVQVNQSDGDGSQATIVIGKDYKK